MLQNKIPGNQQDRFDTTIPLRDNLGANNQIHEVIAKTAMSHVYKTKNNKIFKLIPQSSNEVRIAEQHLFTQEQNLVDTIGLDKEQRGYFMEEAKEDLENYCFRYNQNNHNLVAIFIQMALGLLQFHNQKYDIQGYKQNVYGWTHRDIKISNFLVFEERDPNTNSRIKVKLCDFGIATDKILNITDQGVGTLSYMSPEHFGNITMTYKIDIWALGVAYTQLLTNNPLFSVRNDLQISEQFVKYGQLITNFKPEDLPYRQKDQIRELLLEMLSRDPTQRPTTDQIIQRLLKIQMQMFNSRINNEFKLNFTINQQQFQIRFIKYMEGSIYIFTDFQYGVDFLVSVINEDVVSNNKRPEYFKYLTYCRHPNYIGLKFEIGYNKNLIESPINLLYNYSLRNCYDIIQLIITQFDESPMPFIIQQNKALKKYLQKHFQKELIDVILVKQVSLDQNFVLTLFYLSLTQEKEFKNLVKQFSKLMSEEIGKQMCDLIFQVMGEYISEQIYQYIKQKQKQNDNQKVIKNGKQISEKICKQIRELISEQICIKISQKIVKNMGGQQQNDNQTVIQIWKQMSQQMGGQIINQISNQIGEQISNQINTQIQQQDKQISEQICQQVSGQIGKQMGNFMGQLIGQQIGIQKEEQIVKQQNKQKEQIESPDQLPTQLAQNSSQLGQEIGKQNHKLRFEQIGKQMCEEICKKIGEYIDEQIVRQIFKQMGKQDIKNMMMKDQIPIIKTLQQEETKISELAQFIQNEFNIEQRVKFIYKLYHMIKITYTQFQYIYLYFQPNFNKSMSDVNKLKAKKMIDNLNVSIHPPEYRKITKNNKNIPSYTEFMQFSFFPDKTCDVYQAYSEIIKDIFSDSELYQKHQDKLTFILIKKLHQPILQRDSEQIEIIFESVLNSKDQLKVYHELIDFSSLSLK